MSLRGVDGFDCCDYQQADVKYNSYFGTFNQGNIVPGRRSGNALQILNTAFGESNWTVALGSQNTWGIHMDVSFAGFQAMEFFRISAGATTILALRTRPNGLIDIYARGVLAMTASQALIAGVWNTLELRIDVGAVNRAELRYNGTAVAAGGVNWGSPTLIPDRVSFRFAGFPPGYTIDNYVIWDGQTTDPYSDFLGPVNVDTLLPVSDASAPGAWTPSSGTTLWQMVADHQGISGGAPDGDLSYITPGPTYDALFALSASPCIGKVLAVALNACSRPIIGNQTLQFLFQGTGPERNLGTVLTKPAGTWGAPGSGIPVALVNYATYQVLAALNPDTAAGWIDQEINNGSWGVGAAGTPQRVSAVYLEKLTSMTPQPYNCGSGNYSF